MTRKYDVVLRGIEMQLNDIKADIKKIFDKLSSIENNTDNGITYNNVEEET